MDNIFDVAIVGSGPGGMTTGIYTSRALYHTILIEKDGIPGGQVKNSFSIDNYPGFPENINGAELSIQMNKQAKKYGTEWMTANITKFEKDPNTNIITLSNEDGSKKIQTKTAVLAMGVKPRPLQGGKITPEKVAHYTGKGISLCAVCDGAFHRGKHVAVLGGGNSGVEEAIYLSRFADKVTLIYITDELEAEAIMVKEAKANPKIEYIAKSTVSDLIGDDFLKQIEITNVDTKESQVLDVSGLFLYIGNIPNSLEGIKTNDYGYIITNEKQETNIPGIFAVGDCTSAMVKQITTAVAHGTIASFSIDSYIKKTFKD